MEIRAGGGVFGRGNPGGRGGLVVPEIRVEGGSKKSCHPSGGVWIFSGITQSIIQVFLHVNLYIIYYF